MSTENERFEELCSGYVLNILSEEEKQEFEQLLASASEEQLALFEDMKAAAAEMALLTKLETPPEELKTSLLNKIEESGATRAPVHKMRWYRVAVAASFILVAATLGLFYYSQSLQDQLQSSEQLISQQRSAIQRLETEVQQKEELLTILEARDVDLVMMDGTEEMSPNGYGKVVWDKEGGRALLQVANIPSVPSDKDYQLWFILDGQPISAGVFSVDDPERDNFFKIEQLSSSANQGAFAITMEPKGGMPQPTGDMYLLGNM
ncbi:anti-sigma factor [Gracilimonas mengyeensis]|uniref:Regulator of SigK n=1 Tax=Gracilimonas mengyeensis TaxID=1302730 RepID=A0A521DMP5_9BACT|nr:anti-sigma factor [Gracilimonas mengyeensis]SMO72989.1 Anti-sigma-K factor RskA [Gracilimonas mengyeensis]